MSVSVLMSVYKNEKPEYLKQALDSILNQTMLPAEICVMVDGILPEELDRALLEYKERYDIVKVYRFEKNVKLGRALRAGVERCRSELIARMDTDDIAKRNRLEKQYKYMMEYPDVDVLGGWIEEFDEDNNRIIKRMPEDQKEILQYGKYRNPINHMTVMFRRKAVMEAGNYKHLLYLEDYELWSRMMAAGATFHNLTEVLVEVRAGDAVYRRRSGWEYLKNHRELRNRQRKLGLLTRSEYVKAMILSFGFCMQPGVCRKLTHDLLRNRICRKQMK